MEKGLKIVTIGGGSSYTPELMEGFIKRYNELMLAYKQDQSKRENLHQWYNRKRMIQRQRKAKENGK